jgi:hypothetical protein
VQALVNNLDKGYYLRYLASQQTKMGLLFTCTQQQAAHTYHSKNKHSQVNLEKFNAGEIPRGLSFGEYQLPASAGGISWHAFGNERKAAQRISWLLCLNPD